MLALRKIAPAFGAELVDLPACRRPGPGEVRIGIAAAGICGSDIHAYEWTSGYGFMRDRMPITLGHEFSGVIDAVGEGISGLRTGDRVTCWPTVGCGACSACRDQHPEHCQERSIIGLHTDGGFAEAVIAPAANCRLVPERLPLDLAALTEPLSVAVNAVDVADVSPGDKVVVLGPGPIGLGIAFVAQTRGAEVMLCGLDDDFRLSVARAVGIRHCVDLGVESLAQAADRIFSGSVDRVIEATGVVRSVIDGLSLLRSGGIFVVAGIHSTPLEFDLTCFVRDKKQLRAAHDTTARALDEAISLLSEHAPALAHIVTHREPLTRAIEAFELARGRRAMKVLLLPNS